jgi:hypothetical protein
MAESRDKQEPFKEMILELRISNVTLGKIEQNTLNTADLSLESASGMESFVSEIKLLREDLTKNYKPIKGNKKEETLSAKDSSNLYIISKETASTAFHTFNMIGILEGTYSLTKDILASLQTNRLADAEQRLEDKKARENQTNLKPGGTNQPRLEGGLGSLTKLGILGALAGIAGLVVGFVSGLVETIGTYFTTIKMGIQKIFSVTGITKILEGIFLKIKTFLQESTIVKTITNFFKPIEQFFTGLATESKLIKGIQTMWPKVKGFFEPIKNIFTFLISKVGLLGSIIPGLGTVGSLFANLKTIFGTLSKLGKFLGGPIVTAVIQGALSLFEGFKVFQKTGDIGKALEVGAVGFINAFTGNILDLLKSVVSWIAGALGFEGIEKALDSFSFSDIIAEFFRRFIKTGQDAFEQFFQNFVDIFGDIGNAISNGDIMGTVGEIFRGFMKTLVALPLDIVKGFVASAAGALGANDIEKSIRSVSFAKMFGGTVTQTGAETDSSNKSILGAAGDTTDVKRKQKEAAKELRKAEKGIGESASDTAKELIPAANDIIDKGKALLGISGDANEGFMDMLFKSYNENVGTTVSNITPNPSTIGSDIAAIQSDTANANMAASIMPVEMSSGGGGGNSNVSHSNTSVTYQNNNIPDRTSWMLRPIFGGM